MNEPTIAQVEQAVRAVLAEFGRARSNVSPGRNTTFPGRLLAQRHVESLDPAIRAIDVSPGTVITPLARDLLKRRGVEVRWVSQEAAHPSGRFALAIDTVSTLAGPWKRALLAGSGRWEEVPAEAMTDWLIAGPDRGLALLTDRAALRVWEACQRPGVRAAAVADSIGLAQAIAEIGLNAMVIGPLGQTLHSLKSLADAFERAGVPRGPSHEDRGSDWTSDLFTSAPQPVPRPFLDRFADAPGRLDGRLAGPWRGGGGV